MLQDTMYYTGVVLELVALLFFASVFFGNKRQLLGTEEYSRFFVRVAFLMACSASFALVGYALSFLTKK